MRTADQSATHPLARLGATPTEIEQATKGAVLRPTISLVLNRHRDRLGWASAQAVKKAFPDFDVDAAMNWKWADHGGIVPFGAKPKPAKKHARAAPAKPRPTPKPAHS